MMNNTMNLTNANLNPQDESHRLAHVASNEQPHDGGGWPGDGSGADDFADYNASEADDYRDEPHMYPDDGNYDPSSDF